MRGENVRLLFTAALLLAVTGYTAQKLVRAHIRVPEEIKQKTPNYVFEKEDISIRGGIYDGTGVGGRPYPLVRSTPCWEFRLDPVNMTDRTVRVSGKIQKAPRTVEAQAKTIASALSLDYRDVLRWCRDESNRYRFLAVSSDQRVHDTLANPSYVAGVIVRDTHSRHHYEGSRLAHVLKGVEEKYNKELRGVPGRIRGKRDGRGLEIRSKRDEYIPPVKGADVYLTIDHRLQREAEIQLAEGIAEFGAGSGWCVVLDSATGEVLAMASSPSFDPARPGAAGPECLKNRTIGVNYEPGSVMKVVTAAAALDIGLVRPDTMFDTDRYEKNAAGETKYYKLPGDAGHVWEPKMSVRDAIVHSSNIVMGKVALELGCVRLGGYMRKFGFGRPTGIELPYEERGYLGKYEKWDLATRSRAGIGQGVAVTAIQLASAYQAIANDGVRIPPRIVRKVVDGGGREISPGPRPVPCRAVSAKTSREIRSMMLDVASPRGTARRAAVKGYSVAGKTGTAQKSIPGVKGYAPGLFRASFCGIVPSGVVKRDEGDDAPAPPRIVALVTLDFDERRQFHQGGNSAGPVFRRIASAAMRILEVPADRPDEIFDDYDDEYDRIVEERAERLGDAERVR